jgi:PEP-CTERM motif
MDFPASHLGPGLACGNSGWFRVEVQSVFRFVHFFGVTMKSKLFAAAVLAVASASAFAQTTPVVGFAPSSGFFQSVYNITLTGLSDISGDVDLLGATTGVSVSLFGTTPVPFDGDAADGFSFANLSAGSYQLSFTGFGSGPGAFGGFYEVSPVPEPETYALMLAGLGIVGFVAARRRAQG